MRVFVDSVWCAPESEQYLFSYEVYGGTAIGCFSQGWVSDDLLVGRSAYGQKKIAGPFAATTGTEEFEVFDHDNPACRKRLSVKIPECGQEKAENLGNGSLPDDRNKSNSNGQATDEDFVCPTDFAVYPNPTKDMAWADVPDFGGNPVEIRVMDAAGREVFRQNLGKTSGETVILPVGKNAGNVFFVQVVAGHCILGQRLEVSR